MKMEKTKAEAPLQICTTVPPAKSNAPILFNQPSGAQVQLNVKKFKNKLLSQRTVDKSCPKRNKKYPSTGELKKNDET
jgi:hypothetical protein